MKKSWSIFLILSMTLLVATCKKTPEIPGGSQVEFGETIVDSTGYFGAKVKTEVTTLGNQEVIQHGHCWGTGVNPTVSDFKTELGSIIKSDLFISNLQGLDEFSNYYVRAYINKGGEIIYSNEIDFRTLKTGLPVVVSDSIFDLTIFSASVYNSIVNDSGQQITNKGVCWDTLSLPSIDRNLGFTDEGSGSINFSSLISGLAENTEYFLRAYARNANGLTYSNEFSIRTLFQCGKPILYNGQIYNTVQIGSQCWFKENLNVGVRIDGGQEQTNNGQVEKYCYDDMEANCDIYGGLYQWDELIQYTRVSGERGICPDGWHIPTDEEHTILIEHLGGYLVAGGQLKEAGTEHWWAPNGASNSSGYTALPGGQHQSNGFAQLGRYSRLWSSTEHDVDKSFFLSLMNTSDTIVNTYTQKTFGASVRCLKD